MLATFVIGLREALEAALIIGIVAAFLSERGRVDLLGRVWWGVAIAIGLCLAAAVGLQLLNASLPHQQQEGLETIVGWAAVAMVSYMVIWMQSHARGLRGQLEAAADQALASGSAWALVAMAFLAVLREGLETAVFLLATFQASENAALSSLGALLGIFAAALIGWGLFHGSLRINLARFFRLTSAVLVVMAAGLVMTSLHTAHGAGWINVGQEQVLTLTWLVQPGSIQAAVLTGMLGIQPEPTQIEALGWLLFLAFGLVVVFRPGRASASRNPSRSSAGSRLPMTRG